jgi:hypothetical protein
MSRNSAGAARTGAHVDPAAASGCRACGHPFTMHSNGETECRAAGCKAGPLVTCPQCLGTTVSMFTEGPCTQCRESGTVTGPCAGFASGHQVPELLAS